MKKIVISLKSAEIRRLHIQSQFSKHHLDFSFFDALDPEQAKQAVGFLQLKYLENHITDSELACFMSHVMVWKQVVDENLDLVAIFEDDIYLGQEAHQFLSTDEWVNPKWQIIKIEAFSQFVKLGHSIHHLEHSQRAIRQLVGRHLGAAGYIITQNAAQFLLDYITRSSLVEPLDHILFDECVSSNEIDIFQMTPALCIQSFLFDGSHSKFPSNLEDERIIRRKHESKNRTLNKKLVREFKRIFTRLYRFFFTSKVTFY